MGRELLFRVEGKPIPQGSKQAFIRGSRAVVVDVKPRELMRWRKAVTDVARSMWAGQPPIDSPVWLQLAFIVERPGKPKFETPAVKPDWDKLSRSVCDSLTDAGVYVDDSRVIRTQVEKRFGARAGVIVRVRELTTEGFWEGA